MKKIKKLITPFGLSVVAIGSLLTIVTPLSVSAVTTPALSAKSDPEVACSKGFLTFPTWFRGLAVIQETTPPTTPPTYECGIVSPNAKGIGGVGGFIGHVALNVIEIGLQGAGYVAAGFILFGGFQFLTASGDPALAAKARTTLLNAVIGLGISLSAVAIVNLVSGLLVYHP